ncbi:DUF2076 domain-containing protein [Roseomonas sp. BN140053]|uniref:DUF2076 domain-containing protein n=1 Tax=Roseomonas sp. BN140053 TaxID=3391898 RepID=UPI0039E95A7A
MTEEERRIITDFVTRVSGAQAAPPARSSSPWGGSVPNTQAAPALPPVDPEADRLIGELFTRYPEARYRLTQTAFVQEAAMVQAQNRIQELEWQLKNTQRQAEANQAPQRGGLFGGMFGGGSRPNNVPLTPRPEPMQPPGGMAQQQFAQGRGGSGFLGTALTTAAGVAGGMVLGNALMGMFSGGGAAAAAAASPVADAATGAGAFGQEQVATPASSPWTDPTGAGGQDAVPVADSSAAQDAGWGQDDAQAAGYDNGDDAAGFDDGGFDDEV